MTTSTTRREIRGLYALTDDASLASNDWLERVESALRGGAQLLQYRDKNASDAVRRTRARALAKLCADYKRPFIVNDDVALAREVGAGVHLGQDDMRLVEARAVLGANAVIGVSCYNDIARAQRAQTEGADYVAFGSFFSSRSKPHAVPAALTILRAARTQLALPIVAIGGITPENGAALVDAGADAVAVIEGLFGAANIEDAARRYANLFHEA